MDSSSHKLFQQYPITGKREISIGQVPVPYHTYDGHGLFIGGTADLANITQLLQNENVYPIQTVDGQAVMGIWVVDFTEASLGPHNELQFSILVSHQPAGPIENHPLTLLKALFTDPNARMFCYGLWNNTETAVAYNRELLGLPAQLNQGTIERENGRKTFHLTNEEDQLLFAGQVHDQKRTEPAVGWSLFRLMGLRQTTRAFSQPYIGAKVVNPISENNRVNADAQSFLAADSPVVQLFNTAADDISFNPQQAGIFNFQPQFIEHFAPFRFVYLMPEI